MTPLLQLDFAPPVGYVEPDYKKLAEEAKVDDTVLICILAGM